MSKELVQELKGIVDGLRLKGFKDSDILAITHLPTQSLYNLDSGYGHVLTATVLRRAVMNFMEFKKNAKRFMEGEE